MSAYSEAPSTDSHGLRAPFSVWAFVRKCPAWSSAIIGFLILVLTITNQSIDMDEAQTWDYARLDTLSDVFHELRNDSNSESQMPLGMVLTWAWAKMFGTSEYGMRSLNLAWAAIVMVAFAYIGRRVSIPWLPLLFAIQPFVWYSMDQARTPMMQMAGGSLLLLASLDFLAFRGLRVRAAAVMCLGAVFLCGASMLGVIPLAAVGLGLTLHFIYQRIKIPRIALIILGTTTALLILLAAYYASTLMRGVGEPKIWKVSPANLVFAIYEFLGFLGLGPGRQQLREVMRGLSSPGVLLPYLPGLIILAGIYTGLFFMALKSWFTRPFSRCIKNHPFLLKSWLMGLGTLLVSFVLAFCVGELVGFPLWGRLLAGVFPFWILSLAITIRWALQGLSRKAARYLCAALLLLIVLSSFQIRLTVRHAHDDYRTATTLAIQQASRGRIVWWVADRSGGEYYGLRFALPSERGIIFAHNISNSQAPDVIVLSRPETFDATGSASDFCRQSRFQLSEQLPAFQVWEAEQ
jgi:hypothetical protein